jgi:hypothetical protein
LSQITKRQINKDEETEAQKVDKFPHKLAEKSVLKCASENIHPPPGRMTAGIPDFGGVFFVVVCLFFSARV